MLGDSVDRRVFRADIQTGKLLGTTLLPFAPHSIAVGDGAVWVTGSIDDVVARLDPRTGRRERTTRVGSGAGGLAVGAGAVWLKSSAYDKTLPRISAAVRITPRERQIVELVCEGLRNREIAERMSITQGTVKVHLMHIFEKTGMKDRFQLALEGRHLILGVDESTAEQDPPGLLGRGIRGS